MKKKSISKKVLGTASSLAAITGASTLCDAGVIHVTTPLSIDMSVASPTTVDWDVDGINGPDGSLAFFINGAGEGNIRLNTFMEGFVRGNGTSAGSAIINLNTGFVVGPTLATNYQFGVSGTDHRALLRSVGSAINIVASSFPGFTSGDEGYGGFRFDQNGTTLYGWAAFTLDTTSPGTFTISEWAYEDSGAAITVGDTGSGSAAVPEPSSLALLAMGAAGVAAWRMRKRKTDANSATAQKEED